MAMTQPTYVEFVVVRDQTAAVGKQYVIVKRTYGGVGKPMIPMIEIQGSAYATKALADAALVKVWS